MIRALKTLFDVVFLVPIFILILLYTGIYQLFGDSLGGLMNTNNEEEIAEFMQTGIYSDGTESHGGMKSQIDRGLNKLTDEDAMAIAVFLKNLPAIENLPQANQ